MTRNEVAILTAGLLMGMGAGLVIARSLPPAETAVAGQNSQVEEGSAALNSQSRLFDPEQTPALPTGFGEGTTASEAGNEPAPPRLLPEGEAMPVEPEPVTEAEAKSEPSETSLSAFREELQDVAPELTEKELNDLEQIRSVIGDIPMEDDPKQEEAEGSFLYGIRFTR